MSEIQRTAVIIGAGPAGLTAAYELLTRTDIHPIILEADPDYVGGISRTVQYKGNRIDIGGHRFFSKSDRVMNWWFEQLPVEKNTTDELTYQGRKIYFENEGAVDGVDTEDVLLVRPRKTRIYYDGNFFEYPITLSFDTLKKLGLVKLLKIGVTYTWVRVFPRKPEVSLEDFFINRFGNELYLTFFKSYTEKVWGEPCTVITAEWGAQRVKGLSVTKVLMNALTKPFRNSSIRQKEVETSLIERFLYPKRGPGQLWETVAKKIRDKGGELYMGESAVRLTSKDGKVISVVSRNSDGVEHTYSADFVFSTMPINELGAALGMTGAVRDVSDALKYREFITAGLLLKRTDSPVSTLTDTWIYIHEPSVDVGRIQFFNNWSPYLVADSENTIWIGMEYFCNEGDELWMIPDDEFLQKAASELERLGLGRVEDVIDGTVIRQKKAYTSYTGSYERFPEVRAHLDSIPNLFPIGRNGMHRYNNQDHSMLVAMAAVDNIIEGRIDKSNLWDVNVEQEYHEEK
jgi:protoporphyrinogen oxidase